MPQNVRHRYLANQVHTASPARLVTMLYDALAGDIRHARAALETRDYETLNTKLLRAQAIVLELQGSLKPDLWTGGPGLLALYHYLYKLLVGANIDKRPADLDEALSIVEPLQAAWHEAAATVAAGQAPAVVPA